MMHDLPEGQTQYDKEDAVAQSRAEGANLTDVLAAAFSSGMWKVNVPFIAEHDFWLAKPENLEKFYGAAFEAGKAANEQKQPAPIGVRVD